MKRTATGPTLLMVAGLAVISVAVSRVVATPKVGAALMVLGAVCLTAILGGGLRYATLQWQGARNRELARRMIATIEAPAFVTDAALRLSGTNDQAEKLFSAKKRERLDKAFVTTLAEPASVLNGLLAVARRQGSSGAAATEVAGYRFSVEVLSSECLLWTCQPLSGDHPDAALPDGLPGAVLEADGRVVTANGRLVSELGRTPAHVDEIFTADPGGIDGIARLQGATGSPDVHVFEVDLPGKGRKCLLMTYAGLRERAREAEWDAIEDLPVPLLKITLDGRIAASNREARQLLHITSIEGRRLSDVLDGPGRPINDWLAQATAGKGAHVSEFLRGRSENRDTFVQVTLSTAGAGDGRHLIAVLNDVTELKTLEAQFVQSQKMQAIGQLAGGVAHDFNNLLTAISGHCDLLLLRHDEGHQDYADLIQIHQNTNRAASLVGQLLAFSRKQNLQLETIDLHATLADLTHLLNRLVGEKVTLTLEHAPELGPIRADRRQLEQVLMNLVVNARDAMHGAGEIRVVTSNLSLASPMHKDRVVIPPGDYVVVNVIDTGSGIPPDRLPKIFEPFYTTKRTGEGTGLGLSTVYGIVKQTGGYVFVDSTVGKGSTFSLVFPRQTGGAGAEPVLPPPPEAPQLGGRADGVVLLVEDEAPVRAFASRALRLKGYTVLEADCAEAALEMLESDALHVDIFVTDVIMPGMDGPTWVRKALKSRPDTRVVFVSGYPEDAFDDGEEQIANAVFLPKPFSLTSLTQSVQTQLQKETPPGLS